MLQFLCLFSLWILTIIDNMKGFSFNNEQKKVLFSINDRIRLTEFHSFHDRYQPMEPIHQQLTCDLDDQQELNELSTESPRRSINDDTFLSSSIFSKRGDSISSSTISSGLLQIIRGYFSRLRLLRYAPRSMPTICVFIMVKVIFLLCALGPLLIKVSNQLN